MPLTVKHETVCNLHPDEEMNDEGIVVFHNGEVDEDGELIESDDRAGITFLAYDEEMWRDMGEPEVVTVTVRRGDHLNGDPE